jgi:hypothetical protein
MQESQKTRVKAFTIFVPPTTVDSNQTDVRLVFRHLIPSTAHLSAHARIISLSEHCIMYPGDQQKPNTVGRTYTFVAEKDRAVAPYAGKTRPHTLGDAKLKAIHRMVAESHWTADIVRPLERRITGGVLN